MDKRHNCQIKYFYSVIFLCQSKERMRYIPSVAAYKSYFDICKASNKETMILTDREPINSGQVEIQVEIFT